MLLHPPVSARTVLSNIIIIEIHSPPCSPPFSSPEQEQSPKKLITQPTVRLPTRLPPSSTLSILYWQTHISTINLRSQHPKSGLMNLIHHCMVEHQSIRLRDPTTHVSTAFLNTGHCSHPPKHHHSRALARVSPGAV